jgi:hypothetical protein
MLRPSRLVLACLACLTWPGVAEAAISGTVVNVRGALLPGVSITLVDGDGSSEGFDSTDADGNYSVTPFGGSTPPYLVKASAVDSCDTTGSAFRELAIGPFHDGSAAGNLILDVKSVCAGFQESGGPPPTAIIDPDLARIVSLPGGVAYLNLRNIVGISATDIQLVLADGTPVGGTLDSTNVAITAPAADYDGPLLVGFTVEGQRYTRTIGTLTARKATAPVLPGPIDLQAIVDVSGSMATTDPVNVRRDAVNLLLDLARPGDRVGATGFDNVFRPIFDSTVIDGKAAQLNRLKARAGVRIGNFGGTDYNAGLFEGYRELTGPGVDPNRQKAVIFLTDGANGSTYENLHLRYAFNPSGRSWPICAVQLGQPSTFAPADVALLKRIASETGGQYLATQYAAQLTDLYFRCFGRSTGQKTVLFKAASYRSGQQHAYAERLTKGLASATFFVSWGDAAAKFSATLRAPGGRAYSVSASKKKRGGKVVKRKGRTYRLFRATSPQKGRWKITVKRKGRQGARRVSARVRVTTTR